MIIESGCHGHPTLTPAIFFLCGYLKQRVYNPLPKKGVNHLFILAAALWHETKSFFLKPPINYTIVCEEYIIFGKNIRSSFKNFFNTCVASDIIHAVVVKCEGWG